MSTLKPLGDDVLVGPLPKPAQSEGGIHFADQYRDDSKQYRILAVGPKVKEPEIKVGACCLLDPGTLGVRHLEDGTRRLFVRESRILAVWS